jgi:hypothetical protein
VAATKTGETGIVPVVKGDERMTEFSRTETAEAQPKDFISKDALFALVNQLATQLNEPNRRLLRQIILVVGLDRAQALFEQTLTIEAAGGQMTRDGLRRKTPGGVFISLARAQAVDKAERRRLLDLGSPKKRPTHERTQGAATLPPPPADGASVAPPPPVPAPTWDEAKQLVTEVLQVIGEAKTVKLTLIGRPGKVVQQPSCVVIAMRGKAPPSLPKGLPTPPVNSAITWAVFIATKQWVKVKDSITTNQEDQLIVEGYPLIDPKSNASVVLATSVKSVAQERAQRAPQQAKG